MNSKLKVIVGNILNVEPAVLDNKHAKEWVEPLDSLSLMNLIAAIEEEFNIYFDDHEISNMLNIGSIRDMLSKKILSS